ncbi:hypothetical protein AB0L59_36210 [Streptomyces sp. NPDC052109]|uniref:alpha/beta fold hydrolase n=1 Tax=Streptomyces sp. NPDC052109 TaxID=3155527 RepID=UPI003438A9CC
MSFFSGRDGVRLAYRGSGEGRPLVLPHGVTGDATLWLHHGQADAGPRYRGRSGRVPQAGPHRVGTFEPGSPEECSRLWLRSTGADPVALLHVLDSLVATPAEQSGRVEVPTLVAVGADDVRAAPADELVPALPRGTRAVVPGDHRTAAGGPELVAAIVDFLADHR